MRVELSSSAQSDIRRARASEACGDVSARRFSARSSSSPAMVRTAERRFRSVVRRARGSRHYSHLASRAGDLAEALYVLGRFDEADDVDDVAETTSATDDIDARVRWMPVRAKISRAPGRSSRTPRSRREAVQLAETTDALNRQAKAQRDLGEVLRSPAVRARAAARSDGAHSNSTSRRGMRSRRRARARCSESTFALRLGTRKARSTRALRVAFDVHQLASSGAAAVGISDERSREREQTDCEHDQRAVQ